MPVTNAKKPLGLIPAIELSLRSSTQPFSSVLHSQLSPPPSQSDGSTILYRRLLKLKQHPGCKESEQFLVLPRPLRFQAVSRGVILKECRFAGRLKNLLARTRCPPEILRPVPRGPQDDNRLFRPSARQVSIPCLNNSALRSEILCPITLAKIRYPVKYFFVVCQAKVEMSSFYQSRDVL